MILLINTADAGTVVVVLLQQGKVVKEKTISTPHHGAGKILTAIENLLSGRNVDALSGIIVVIGPGPFTAVRLGVVVANTISWTLQVPIIGVKRTSFVTLADLVTQSEKIIKRAKLKKIVLPYYGKEPNITLS